jgi:putative inorganic carbon (HCO3(-)) transporter
VSVITTADGTRILRAYGLTDHPNILGGVLAVGLLLLAGLIAHSGAPGARRVMAGTLALAAAFAVGAAALLVTFSRGAWMGLAAGAVVGTLMLGRLGGRRPALARQMAGLGLAGALAVAPLTLVFLPVLGARTGVAGPIATETRSISERGALAEVVSEVAAAHPVLGVGIGTLPLAVHAAEPAFAFDAQPASIVALDVTAELGLAGGLLYVALAVGPWVALLRRRAAWTLELAAASAALAAVSVLGFFDYYTWSYQAGRIWAWLVLGLWIVAWRASTGGDRAAIALGGHADAA